MCMCLNTMLMLQNGKAQSIIILFCPKNYFFFAKRVQIPIRIKHKWLLMWVYTHVSKFFWALPKRLAFALPKFIFFNYNQSQSTWNSPSWMKMKISGTCKIFQKLMKKTLKKFQFCFWDFEKISILFLGLWQKFGIQIWDFVRVWRNSQKNLRTLKNFSSHTQSWLIGNLPCLLPTKVFSIIQNVVFHTGPITLWHTCARAHSERARDHVRQPPQSVKSMKSEEI